MYDALRNIEDNKVTVTSVALGKTGSYSVTYGKSAFYTNTTRSH
jgi:hypothetical protein